MTDHQQQLPLFAGSTEPARGRNPVHTSDAAQMLKRSAPSGRAQPRTVKINSHLLAARRIARKMRRLPEHSEAETRAGLAICAQLKAFLADTEVSDSECRTTPH